MLTPVFSIEQTDEHLLFTIEAPYAKIAETEIEYAEELFVFSSKPYFLRVHLPSHVLDDETGWAKYDSDSGTFSVAVPKRNKGEFFAGLEMITELLRPRKKLPTARPAVEEVAGSSSPNFEASDEDSDEEEYCMEQNPTRILDNRSTNNERGYGFAWKRSGVLGSLIAEIDKLIELKDPESSPINERAQQCVQRAIETFNGDHYLADTFEPDDQLENALLQEYVVKTALSQSDKKLLIELSRRKLTATTKTEDQLIANSLVDICFAFCYDGRTTDWEKTVESGWTIVNLAPSLCWLARFDSPRDALIAGCYMALSRPLYRNWALCEKVFADLKALFAAGRVALTRALCKIHRLMVSSGEFRYLFNDLLLADLLVWIQRVDESLLSNVSAQLERIELTRADLEGLNLDSLEMEGQVSAMQIDDEEVLDSDDSPA